MATDRLAALALLQPLPPHIASCPTSPLALYGETCPRSTHLLRPQFSAVQ